MNILEFKERCTMENNEEPEVDLNQLMKIRREKLA